MPMPTKRDLLDFALIIAGFLVGLALWALLVGLFIYVVW